MPAWDGFWRWRATRAPRKTRPSGFPVKDAYAGAVAPVPAYECEPLTPRSARACSGRGPAVPRLAWSRCPFAVTATTRAPSVT